MSVSKSSKSKKEKKVEKEVDLKDIYYFSRPHHVAGLAEKKISKVYGKGAYCYALAEETNEVYSWGLNYNCVLGTSKHENIYEPFQVNAM